MSTDGYDRFYNFILSTLSIFETPVVWFRESIVKPNQKYYPWYHRQYPRVPTIDQCYDGDLVCDFEANVQYKRDRAVDSEILSILRNRFEDCVLYERPDVERCQPIYKQYKDAEENWFIKYGDLGAYASARRAFMKQKHRMIWERRHGPVGSGMKEDYKNAIPEED